MMLKINNLTINRKSHLCLTGVLGCLYICSPSGSGKTNLFLDMIYRLLYYDKIFLYAKTLQQGWSKYQHLIDLFGPVNEEAGYPIIEASNNKIIPLDKMPFDNQKLVIFDV